MRSEGPVTDVINDFRGVWTLPLTIEGEREWLTVLAWAPVTMEKDTYSGE